MSDSESIRATVQNTCALQIMRWEEREGLLRAICMSLYVCDSHRCSSFCTFLPDSQGYPEFSVECIYSVFAVTYFARLREKEGQKIQRVAVKTKRMTFVSTVKLLNVPV